VKDLNTMTKTKAKRLKMSAGILDASDVLEDSKTTQTIISLYNIFRLPRNKLTRFRCELLWFADNVHVVIQTCINEGDAEGILRHRIVLTKL